MMSVSKVSSLVAVFGCTVMGLAECGGSGGIEVGDLNLAGAGQSASGGSGGSGGSDGTGGGVAETGGSSVGSSGAGGMSNGAGGMSSGAGGAPSVDASVGGSGGTGGDATPDAGDPCKNLVAAYELNLLEAKRCNPAMSAPQCQSTAPSSLPCPGCSTRVQDATRLSQIRAKWTAAGCKGGICPAIACILPGEPRCIPTDGGGGICGSSGLVQ